MRVQIAACAFMLAALPIRVANADPDPGGPPIDAGADDRGFWGAAEDEAATPNAASGTSDTSGTPISGPQIILGATACVGAETIAVGGDPDAAGFCPGSQDAPETLGVGDVRNAFARLDLPAAKLVIQPPDGLTLVNFDTNFYTTSTRSITRTVTLLGQQVTLVATPAEFRWAFGDGESLATTEPGTPYPDLTVTHNYVRTGSYRPSLDTVFTGRFRVGNGPWQQIPGTVTIEGEPQSLRAIEAQPKLVGY